MQGERRHSLYTFTLAPQARIRARRSNIVRLRCFVGSSFRASVVLPLVSQLHGRIENAKRFECGSFSLRPLAGTPERAMSPILTHGTGCEQARGTKAAALQSFAQTLSSIRMLLSVLLGLQSFRLCGRARLDLGQWRACLRQPQVVVGLEVHPKLGRHAKVFPEP
jgi:hypothetical protein